jgi:hypothetical protein
MSTVSFTDDMGQQPGEMTFLTSDKSKDMSNDNLTKVTAEHSEWLNGLDFYKKDILILEKRLLELGSRKGTFDMSLGIEHFQNQFLIQRNTIDELRHSIREHVSNFGRMVAVEDASKEEPDLQEHESLKDGYLSFEKVMNELRHEFNDFLAKWL